MAADLRHVVLNANRELIPTRRDEDERERADYVESLAQRHAQRTGQPLGIARRIVRAVSVSANPRLNASGDILLRRAHTGRIARYG
jgi:hypothetical protein